MNRPCGTLLRKVCCSACKGLTSVGLADSLRVTHCLDEGKSNRKGSLKRSLCSKGPRYVFFGPLLTFFVLVFPICLTTVQWFFGFADCCTVLSLIQRVEGLSLITFVRLILLFSLYFMYVFGVCPTCMLRATLTLCHSCVLVAHKFTLPLVRDPSKRLRGFW